MKTAFTIDWLSVTFPEHGAKVFLQEIEQMAYHASTRCIPARGYNHGIEYNSGLRVSWHDKKPEQGTHVVFSGSTLRWYYALGLSWHAILRSVKMHGGRSSRVDLALDVWDSGLNPIALSSLNLRPYKGQGRTPKLTTLIGSDSGWTVYVGSRQSEKFMRVYDKGIEQGEKTGDYVRVELECKGEVAHAVGWEFPNMDAERCVDMARTLIRGQADFNLANWDAALSSEIVELAIPQGRQRDTFGWLVKQCAPALAKEIAKHPDEPILDEFWDALRIALRDRGIEA